MPSIVHLRRLSTLSLSISAFPKVDFFNPLAPPHPLPSHPHPPLPRRKLLQLRQSAIEDITIASIRVTIRILPNSLKRPTARDRAGGTAIARQYYTPSASPPRPIITNNRYPTTNQQPIQREEGRKPTQRTRPRKPTTIPRTSPPPVISAVDERIPPRLRTVRGHEVRDPGHHRGRGQPVAGRAAGAVFDV